MRRSILFSLLLWCLTCAAQYPPKQSIPSGWPTLSGLFSDMRTAFSPAFSHLDVSVTTGATGIGFDLSTPLTDNVSLRGGYAIMPHFTHTMHFGVDVGEDPEESERKFNRLSGLLANFTGNQVDNVVDMKGQPTYWNWKLLVDVKPFPNKNWHLTAGVFAGTRQVAKAVNAVEDMPSLMAVNIYNNLYDKAMNNELEVTISETTVNLSEMLGEKLQNYGRMSIHMGNYTHNVYYEEDEYVTAPEGGIIIGDNFYDEGEQILIHAKGDVKYAMGDPYRIVPDENSMVKAWAYANRIKPYLGFGYGGRLLKNNPHWEVSFDCGAMFWGGTPKVVTHDGTDLVNDVYNVRGKVGDYVHLIKKFKVFPVLNIRLTRRLF